MKCKHLVNGWLCGMEPKARIGDKFKCRICKKICYVAYGTKQEMEKVILKQKAKAR